MNTTTQMPRVVLAAPAGKFLGLTVAGHTGLLVIANLFGGGAMSLLRPELLLVWILVMAFVPVVMFGLRFLPGWSGLAAQVRLQLERSVLVAGVLIFIPVLLRLIEALGVVEFAAASRSIGVTIGLGILLTGGFLARGMLTALSSRVGAACAARMLGFASWSIMAGGFGYALLWLVAPLQVAGLWASCALGAALLVVALRSFVALQLHNRRPTSER